MPYAYRSWHMSLLWLPGDCRAMHTADTGRQSLTMPDYRMPETSFQFLTHCARMVYRQICTPT